MTQLKAFAALIVVAFTVDTVAFDGAYRHAFARNIHHVVYQVSDLHWTGFIGH